MKENSSIISKRLSSLLSEQGLSQASFAENAKISEQTLTNIMQGHRTPNAGTLEKIADSLGVYTDYLTGRLPYKDFGSWLDMLSEYSFNQDQEKAILQLLESWGYQYEKLNDNFYRIICPNGQEKILCRNHLVFIITNFFSTFEMILLPDRLFPSNEI